MNNKIKSPFSLLGDSYARKKAAMITPAEPQEEQASGVPQHFVLTLLHSVTNAHILHLQSLSFAEHTALGSYYDEVGDLVDGLVEAYQGKYGIITNYQPTYDLPAAPLEYLSSLSEYVKVARKHLPQDSELQNMIDEIAALLDTTIYKLKFLK